MLNRLGPRLSYANVLSTVALFAALGGGAYAAIQLPPNSVGTKQLKKDAVRSSKVKDHSLKRRDVKPGAFATPGQLKGIDAAKLGGIGAAGFLHGSGTLVGTDFDTVGDEDVLSIPGGGQVSLKCDSSGYNTYFRTTATTYDVYQSTDVNGTEPVVQHRTVTPNPSLAFIPVTAPSESRFDIESGNGSGVITMWTRFDNATKHCIGRVRGFVIGPV